MNYATTFTFLMLMFLVKTQVIPITDPEVEKKKLEQLQNFPRNGRPTKITPREHQRLIPDNNNTRISAGLGSTMRERLNKNKVEISFNFYEMSHRGEILTTNVGTASYDVITIYSGPGTSQNQEVPTSVEKISFNFPEDKVPIDFIASSWSYIWRNSTVTVGTYYHSRETLMTKDFNQAMEISGPTMLTFLKLIRGLFSLKMIGDRSEIVMDFNITYQVSPDEVKVDVSSNFSFNITMTCSREDVKINGTFICENKTCRQEGGERSKVTKSGGFLRLYLLNSTIICSHSNQISKTQNQTTILPKSASTGCTDQTTLPPVGTDQTTLTLVGTDQTTLTLVGTDQTTLTLVGIGVIVVAAIIGVAVLKKRKLLCFAPKAPKAENLQMFPQTPQVNGDPGSDRLMEENTV